MRLTFLLILFTVSALAKTEKSPNKNNKIWVSYAIQCCARPPHVNFQPGVMDSKFSVQLSNWQEIFKKNSIPVLDCAVGSGISCLAVGCPSAARILFQVDSKLKNKALALNWKTEAREPKERVTTCEKIDSLIH